MIQFIIVSIICARYMRRFALRIMGDVSFSFFLFSFLLFFLLVRVPKRIGVAKVRSIDMQRWEKKEASAGYELNAREFD